MASPPDKAAETPPPPADELAQWLAKYGPALHRYFARKANPALADDLVQEVFLRLQVRAGRAHSEDIEGYLFTVARNVLIDRFRADRSRLSTLHDPLDDADDFPDDISPERILAAKQEYARALVAILELPPRMRMALVLHRFGKLSFSAVAKRMGITKSGVQNLIRRAMERVAEELGDES